MNDATFQYPTTMAGDQPEYGSVIITLDHLSAGRPGNPHVHNKFVFSTQDEVEAALANFAYYGESTLGLNPTVIKTMGELFTKDYPVLVYNPAPNPEAGFAGATQIIMAMDAFIEAINADNFGGGSILMTVEIISQMVGRITVDKLQGAPEGSRLPFFGFELDVQPDELPENGPGTDFDGPQPTQVEGGAGPTHAQ